MHHNAQYAHVPKDPKDHGWWICLLINRLSRAADEHKEQGVSAVDGRKTFAQLVSGKWLSSPSCAQARNGEGFKKPTKQHDMAVDSLVDIYSANNSFHHPVTRRVIDCAWLTKVQEASQDVLGHGHSRFFLKMEEPCHADPNIDLFYHPRISKVLPLGIPYQPPWQAGTTLVVAW